MKLEDVPPTEAVLAAIQGLDAWLENLDVSGTAVRAELSRVFAWALVRDAQAHLEVQEEEQRLAAEQATCRTSLRSWLVRHQIESFSFTAADPPRDWAKALGWPGRSQAGDRAYVETRAGHDVHLWREWMRETVFPEWQALCEERS